MDPSKRSLAPARPALTRWAALAALSALAVLATLLVACSSSNSSNPNPDAASTSSSPFSSNPNDQTISTDLQGQSIVVYSGRTEALIEPIIKRFEVLYNAEVSVRYGNSADLALQIDSEGSRTPADVFISQSPGAIGYLSQAGRLSQLPATVLGLLPAGSRPADQDWVGLTGRQRVLVYNPNLVASDDLPASVFDLTDSKYAGRVGVAPQNGSFQDFITAMRLNLGDAKAEEWLAGMAANKSPNYSRNSAIVDAVVRGEVDMGLVNHYYLWRLLAEDPNAQGANHYFASDDIGSLVIATGAAVLRASDAQATAGLLLEFLLSEEAQEYFASDTREYPLSIAGAALPSDLPPLPELSTAALDWSGLGGGLARTVELIRDSGIER